MTDPNLNNLVSVSVSSEVRSGAGFGVVIGTGGSCLIPSRVMYAADLTVGDLIKCRLVDNPSEEFRLRTPYMVAYVDPEGTANLRLAVSGGTPLHEAAATPAQLELPLESPKDSQVAQQLGALADRLLPAPEPAPTAPAGLTRSEVRDMTSALLMQGGVWSLGDIRDSLWPGEEIPQSDVRYKLSANAVLDLHATSQIVAFGRRASPKSKLSCLKYTMYPEDVRIVCGAVSTKEMANA